jgi:glycosyltransferase involved in cell wall biosynthesis
MKVAVISSATGGGAGIAASRVADALRLHAHIDVHQADTGALGIVAPDVSPQINVSNGRLSNTHFTADFARASREWCVRFLATFDVVNVHWSSYLLSISDLQLLAAGGVRLLLTMHDFNAVTGGCHYPAGCTGLFKGCEGCPQVDPNLFSSSDVMKAKALKMALLRHPNVHLCAPSCYVLDAAALATSIGRERLHLIRNPYTPLNLPRPTGERPFTVLLVADSHTERRKGAALASEALQQFVAKGGTGGRPLRVHVAGAAHESFIRALRASTADVLVHGRITKHANLAALYAQCDVQLLTSYEDNWPNVLSEGGAYGCLAVVGPGHGCEEFVREFGAGGTAEEYTPQAFASTLARIASLDPATLASRQRALAADVIRTHDPALIASQYTRAFESLKQADTTVDELPSNHPFGLSSRVSSNFLGVESRLLLAGPHAQSAAAIEISRVGVQAPATVLTLNAVYGDPGSPSVAKHRVTGASMVLPLETPEGRLQHVFAQEQSDYGLTQLRCAMSDSLPAFEAGSSTPL